ncbi:MAG TPA: division/cell wall cluster transcriptional repressor MraZ [Spongiibacteraceae bacterium]
MYSGSYAVTMDAKGRLAIPVRFREQLQAEGLNRLVVTAHHADLCVLIYPESQWRILAPQIQALPNIKSASVRRLQRLVLGNASPQEMDANGRILLPPTLRDLAGLGKDLVVAGLGHRLEIWNESDWNGLADAKDDADGLPEAALELNI